MLSNIACTPFTYVIVPLKKPVFGGNCLQPIVWLGKTLEQTSEAGVYTSLPPKPTKAGHWVGYFVEIYFPEEEQDGDGEYKFTSKGYVWPDTYPFDDCHTEEECRGILV